MSNELVPQEVYGGVAAYDPAALVAVSKSGSFLARLQLFGANSTLVKEEKIGMGHYGLVTSKDAVSDLGKEVEVLALAAKAKAMRWDGDNVFAFYDHNLPQFKEIQSDSEQPNSGCMWGPEFLVYVPFSDAFATFFLSSPTARRVGPDLLKLVSKAAILTSTLIKNARFSWHGPVVNELNNPTWQVPTTDSIVAQITKFRQQKSSEVETTATAGRAR